MGALADSAIRHDPWRRCLAPCNPVS